jgi:hypothetical protein
MDVKIRQGGIDVHIHRPHRMGAVGEPALDAVFQGLEEGIVGDPPAVRENILLPPVAPVKFRPPQDKGHGETRPRKTKLVEERPFPPLEEAQGETLLQGRRRGEVLLEGPLLDKAEAGFGEGQGLVDKGLAAEDPLAGLPREETLSSGNGVEKPQGPYGGPPGTPGLFDPGRRIFAGPRLKPPGLPAVRTG